MHFRLDIEAFYNAEKFSVCYVEPLQFPQSSYILYLFRYNDIN